MKKYMLLSLAITMFACNSTNEVKQEAEQRNGETDSTISAPSTMPGHTIISETGDNCNRGEPASILKKGSFSNSTFELQSIKKMAVETFQNANNEKVTIKNWGCEYVALTFRFETSRFEGDLSNTGFWYKRATTLLNEINGQLDAPIDIVKGTERLVTEIENDVPNGYANLKLNNELDFEEHPRSFVRIDKVEKLHGQKFAIEVTFAKGPL